MVIYVYAQGRGKFHAFRQGTLPDEVRPYVWRVRTVCGQQLDEAYRSFLGYTHPKVRCSHCFPPRREDSR